MSNSRLRLALAAVFACVIALASCASDEPTAAEPTTTAEPVTTVEEEDDHDDENGDHDDEDGDHDEEDGDHDDHDDEDGDHDDEDGDHDDEDGDHDDEDHDDHDDDGGLGAHEHGSAELSVAWIDSDIVIDLVSPNQNVFGFEYEPETDEDIATEKERSETLMAEGIITVNAEANCSLSEPASLAVERDGNHSEVTVSWTFTCDSPDDIEELDLSGLFAEFPGFEDIDAEWVSATSQSSAELSPSEPTLTLES